MGLSLRGQSSGAIDINAPNAAGNNTITLPGSNGAANQFYKNSGTAGTLTHSSMIELSNGRIGIGSDNPNAALSVLSAAYPTVTITRDHPSNYPRLRVTNTSTDGADLDGLGSGGGFRIACVAAGVSTERVRITSAGNLGIGDESPTYRVSAKDTKADGTGVQLHLWNNSVNNTAGNVWSGIRFTGSTGDYETAEIKGWRVHPGTGVNSLSINTGGVERMVLSSSGVGIGEDEPEAKLEVSGGQNQTANQFVDLLKISANANNDADAAEMQLNFGISASHTSTANRRARIQAITKGGTARELSLNPDGGYVGVATDNPGHPFEIHSSVGTNIVAKSTNGNGGYLNYSGLDSSGTTTFSVNHNGTIYTASGLNFGTATGDVTSQTLGDFEEGTWTATAANGITLHSNYNLCSYTKIGRQVTVLGQFRVNNANGGAELIINNLPFTNLTVTEGEFFAVGTTRLYDAGITGAAVQVICFVDSNSNNLRFTEVRDNASDQTCQATADGYYMFTCTYFAA